MTARITWCLATCSMSQGLAPLQQKAKSSSCYLPDAAIRPLPGQRSSLTSFALLRTRKAGSVACNAQDEDGAREVIAFKTTIIRGRRIDVCVVNVFGSCPYRGPVAMLTHNLSAIRSTQHRLLLPSLSALTSHSRIFDPAKIPMQSVSNAGRLRRAGIACPRHDNDRLGIKDIRVLLSTAETLCGLPDYLSARDLTTDSFQEAISQTFRVVRYDATAGYQDTRSKTPRPRLFR